MYRVSVLCVVGIINIKKYLIWSCIVQAAVFYRTLGHECTCLYHIVKMAIFVSTTTL